MPREQGELAQTNKAQIKTKTTTTKAFFQLQVAHDSFHKHNFYMLQVICQDFKSQNILGISLHWD